MRVGEHAAVQCSNLTKDHGEGRGLICLDLAVAEGERVAVVGHNGSGKTTLMRLLAGLAEPTSGDAWVFGHRAGSLDARRDVAYVGDQPTFYDDLSLRQHLVFVGGLYGDTPTVHHHDHLLEVLGLAARADDLPTRFSRGLRQKAALAVALARPFRLLLIDEPFVGLDATGRRALLGLLDDASDRGVTVITATHDRELAATARRLVVLGEGRLTHDGPIDDLEAFMSTL